MAGKIKNCPMCGKLFADTGHRVCMDCYEKILEKEAEVVNYVRDNPGSKIPEIVEATGATEGMIKKMIREGRFEQIGVKMSYPCEQCGNPIITGKICQSCQEELHKELQKKASAIIAAKQATKPTGHGHGMYSKNNLGCLFNMK